MIGFLYSLISLFVEFFRSMYEFLMPGFLVLLGASIGDVDEIEQARRLKAKTPVT